jgi:DNA-binding transcriptional regulator YiaG
MSKIASVLKTEFQRLARREIKPESARIKRAVMQCRHDIAHLRRLVAAQAKQISRLQNQVGNPTQSSAEEAGAKHRFSARSVKAQRMRLGLSALDYGKLVGVSPLTIYAWEQGKSRPRKAQLAALIEVRGIGKREARQRVGGNRKVGPKEKKLSVERSKSPVPQPT